MHPTPSRSSVPTPLHRPEGPKAGRVREVLGHFNPDEYGLQTQSPARRYRTALEPGRCAGPDCAHGCPASGLPKSRTELPGGPTQLPGYFVCIEIQAVPTFCHDI